MDNLQRETEKDRLNAWGRVQELEIELAELRVARETDKETEDAYLQEISELRAKVERWAAEADRHAGTAQYALAQLEAVRVLADNPRHSVTFSYSHLRSRRTIGAVLVSDLEPILYGPDNGKGGG